jgi:hypothetical protein
MVLVAKPVGSSAWSEADAASLGVAPDCQFPVPLSFGAAQERSVGKRRYPRFFKCMQASSFTCGAAYEVRAHAQAAGATYAPSAWTPASAAFLLVPQCDPARTAGCKWGPATP